MEIDRAALDSVTEKLHAFAEGLDEAERAVVESLITKAVADDEVAGFSFSSSGLRGFGIGTPNFQRPQFNQQLGGLFCDDDEDNWFKISIWESMPQI